MDINNGNKALPDVLSCNIKLSSQIAIFVGLTVNCLTFLFPSKILFDLLQFLCVPRIIPDIIVAILQGNTWTQISPSDRFKELLEIFGAFFFGAHLFVKGLEMDLFSVVRLTPATMLAYFAGLSSMLICCLFVPFLSNHILGLTDNISAQVIVAFAVAIANTDSSLLTRLATRLKISKFEVGRLSVSAGITIDMLLTLVVCIGFLFINVIDHTGKPHGKTITRVIFFVFEVCLLFATANTVSEWIDDHNPQGKKMDGIYVGIFLAFVAILYGLSYLVGYDVNLNCFLIGLAMPRNGRISRYLIAHFSFFVDSFVLPFIVFQAGVFTGKYGKYTYNETTIDELDFSVVAATMLTFWFIGTVGKISGVLASRAFHRQLWLDCISTALLLNIKGHFHVYLAWIGYQHKMIRGNTVVAMLMLVMISILYLPSVAFIVGRTARRRNKSSLMGFQWHKPANDLRMVMCLYCPEDMPVALNVVEALRWGDGTSQLRVFSMDLVELTEKSAATLVQGEGTDAVMLADESVTEMREHIGSVLDAYLMESSEGINIRRLLAVSTWSEMDDDICNAADENMAIFVLLPFHRRQMVNGNLDEGHIGHRLVNQRMQGSARCTVGILMQRGGGRTNQASTSQATQNVAVVFIGGADDREALSIGKRMAQHPGIHLTVVRFLLDVGATQTIALGHRVMMHTPEQEVQMGLDDEFFAEFYEQNITRGNTPIDFIEKRVINGAETVAFLQTLEEHQNLFVVGRGKDRDSVLTSGMEEWAEFPELGAIGDVLATPDFSVKASILVIQQYDSKRELGVIDDEFMPVY